MDKYEFWVTQNTVKNEDDFQKPDAVVESSSIEEAAIAIGPTLEYIHYLGDCSWYQIVVRNTTNNRWFYLEITREWAVSSNDETTFAQILKDFEG